MAKNDNIKLSSFSQVGETRTGSQKGVMFKAKKNGELYGIKLHGVLVRPELPKWDSENDFGKKKYERACIRVNNIRACFDQYYDYKSRLYAKARNGEKRTNAINCPLFFWQECATEYVKGERVCIEAVPWLTKVADVEADTYPTLRSLDEKSIREIFTSFAKSLALLHSHGVVHSDIKPANLVITKNKKGEYQGCLIDFDMCFFEDEKPPLSIREYIMGGTDNYKPPEMITFDASLTEEEYDYSKMSYPIDIFAFGISMFEYLCKDDCVPLENGKEIEYKSSLGKALFDGVKTDLLRESFECTLSDFFVAVIGWCLDADPSARPTAAQLAEVLASGKESDIPIKYRRFNPYAPWEDGYVFNEALQASRIIITRAEEQGLYKVSKSGRTITLTEKQMLSAHLLIKSGEEFNPKGYVVNNNITPWEKNIVIHSSVSKAVLKGERYGEYIIKEGDFEKTVDLQVLLAEGLATDDAEALSPDCDIPWQEDCIEFISPKIRRAQKVGQYRFLSRKNATLSADELLEEGLAKKLPYDCCAPINKKIAFIKDEQRIFQAHSKRNYIVVLDQCYKADNEGLIANGFAALTEKPKKTDASADDRVWACDNIIITTELSVSKAKREGIYSLINVGGIKSNCSAKQLVALGYAVEKNENKGLFEPISIPTAVKAIFGKADSKIDSIDKLLLAIYNRQRASVTQKCKEERGAEILRKKEEFAKQKRRREQEDDRRKQEQLMQKQQAAQNKRNRLNIQTARANAEYQKKRLEYAPLPVDAPEPLRIKARAPFINKGLVFQSACADLENYVKVKDPAKRKLAVKKTFKVIKWIVLSLLSAFDLFGIVIMVMFLVKILG